MSARHVRIIQFCLLWFTWCSPLLYVPYNTVLSRSLRFAFLAVAALLLIGLSPLRNRLVENYRRLAKGGKTALLVIVAAMIISSVFSHTAGRLTLIGYTNEYLGVLTWLSFLVIGLACADRFNEFIKSRALLIGICLIVIGSYFADLHITDWHAFRLNGLLMQATAMGFYAAITLVLLQWHWLQSTKSWGRAVLFGGMSLITLGALVATQSRAAVYLVVVVLLGMVAVRFKQERRALWLPVTTVAVLLVVPMVFSNHFSRFRPAEVSFGTSYRYDIYGLTAQEAVAKHPIIGSGPASLPLYINNPTKVPPPLLQTLNDGYVFLSAHNIFLDSAVYFGLPAALALLFLIWKTIQRAYYLLRNRSDWLIPALLVVLLVEALIDIPSLELTAMLFTVVFGVILTKPTHTAPLDGQSD